MKLINILVVDDHPVLREGISIMLEAISSFSIRITTACNGIEALQKYKEDNPDLILTDIRMPRMDGIELTRAIRKKDKNTPILMMTVLSNLESVSKGVELGINGYLTKLSGAEEIQLAVETLLRGENYFSSEVSQLLLNSRRNRNGSGLNDLLTDRELQVLRLISEDYSQEEMAKELNISPRTIEGHARNLRSKLKVKSSAGLVMSAIKQGLID